MPARIDCTGKRFGKLLVLCRTAKRFSKKIEYYCLCDCGNTTITVGHYLRHEVTKSCGCIHRKQLISRNKSNGNPPLKIECHYCGKTCSKSHYDTKIKDHLYCSKPCMYKGRTKYTVLTTKIRKSRSYQAYYSWRSSVYERDSYTCHKCGDSSGGNLNAHHIMSYTRFPELSLNVDNGITLCKRCHVEFHKVYGVTLFTSGNLYEYLS